MAWEVHFRRHSARPIRPTQGHWIVVGLFWCLLVPTLYALAGPGKQPTQPPVPAADPCQSSVQESATHLQNVLDVRLRRGFPVTAQLDEGNARLSPLAILAIDCEQQRVVVSSSYEFRGNLGVMDITRRGTTLLQFHLRPHTEQRQVWLEAPKVLEVTFDNPAPWFDGKAISAWVLSLFSKPVCASLENGQPC
jgi:hypothetical protein